jgi:hypothetical protein
MLNRKRTDVGSYSEIHHLPCKKGDVYTVDVFKEDNSGRERIGHREFTVGSL